MMNSSAVLAIWERGLAVPATRRARALADDMAGALPLGAANARMLRLRQELFGPVLECLADCTACGARLEVPVTVDALLARAGDPAPEHELTLDGVPLRFRLPALRDLDTAAAAIDADTAVTALLHACLVEPPAELPSDVAERLGKRMAELDPLAETELDLTCVECGAAFASGLEIGGFLWQEIAAQAAKALAEVHRLASAYGWREADILALTPARRQAYLDLVGG